VQKLLGGLEVPRRGGRSSDISVAGLKAETFQYLAGHEYVSWVNRLLLGRPLWRLRQIVLLMFQIAVDKG